MKEASKVIMGTTLAMAITLAIILSLILILLAELYCSLLLNRRRKTATTATTTATTATDANIYATLPAPGVLLHPPRNILFPQNIETNNNINLQDQNPTIESPKEHLVYICNPIYDGLSGSRTPYETPESSPSHLEYSDEEENMYACTCIYSPQLMPMKKLYAEACSVSLRDASSLATSGYGSETNSNNGVSSTESRSPSW